MALKRKIKALTDVPEAVRGEYVKAEGGGYVLDVDGDPDDSERVKEFRAKNIALLKEKEEWEKKYAGIDPEMVQAGLRAIEKAKNDEERELLRAGRFEDVINMRLAGDRSNHAKQLKERDDKLSEAGQRIDMLRGTLRGTRITNHVIREAARRKLVLAPTAHEDLVRRALDEYDVDDAGRVVMAPDEDGNDRVNAAGEAYGDDDFFQGLVEGASHLFGASQGSDVRGTGKKGSGGAGAGATVEIDANDPRAFGDNLENIASGKVTARIKR